MGSVWLNNAVGCSLPQCHGMISTQSIRSCLDLATLFQAGFDSQPKGSFWSRSMKKQLTRLFGRFLFGLSTIVGLSCCSSTQWPAGNVFFTTGEKDVYQFHTANAHTTRPLQIVSADDPNQVIEFRELSHINKGGLLIEMEKHDYPPDFNVSLTNHEWQVINFWKLGKNGACVFTTGKKREYVIQNDSNGKTVLTDGYLGFAATSDGKTLATVDMLRNELSIIDLNGISPSVRSYRYPFESHCPRPEAFSPDKRRVYCTGSLADRSGLFIIYLELQYGTFNVWRQGSSPIVSPRGMIAYLDESDRIVIADPQDDNPARLPQL